MMYVKCLQEMLQMYVVQGKLLEAVYNFYDGVAACVRVI